MKNIITTIAALIILAGCSKTQILPQEKQSDCISDNCSIENCIKNNQNICRTPEGESGDVEDKTSKLNNKHPEYHCEWAMNNMSNLFVINCSRK